MFNDLGAAGLWANAKIFGLAIVLALIALLVEDIIAFTQGKDSIFGSMLEDAGIDPEPYREAFEKVGKSFKALWEAIEEDAGKISVALGLNEVDWASVATAAIHAAADTIVAIAEISAAVADVMVITGTLIGEALAEAFLFWTAMWDEYGISVDEILSFWVGVWTGTIGALGAAWEAMVTGMGLFWSESLVPMWEIYAAIMLAPFELLSALWDAYTAVMMAPIDLIIAAVEGLLDFLTDAIDAYLTIMLAPFDLLADILNELPDFILDELPEGVAEFAREGIQVTSSLKDIADEGEDAGAGGGFIPSIFDVAAGAGPVTNAGGTSTTTVNVTAPITVDGSVAMDDEGFEDRMAEAAMRAFSGIIEQTYEDTAEAA
jgi:hypothetical protein